MYRHTQQGTLLWSTTGGVGLLALAWVVTRGAPLAAVIVVLIVAATILFLFHSLTVEVTTTEVRAQFGPGWIRRTLAVRRIRDVRAVRNRWWYGWGIRRTPHGWMFNVSGLDAVELTLDSGKRFRIGTDRPTELEAAVRQARDRAARSR